MKFIFFAAFAAVVTAQTTVTPPANYPSTIPNLPVLELQAELSITYPTFEINATSSGTLLTIPEVSSVPIYSITPALSGQYTLIMIDPDAPSPEQPTWAQILHAVHTNLVADANGVLTAQNAAPVPYIGSQPGEGSAHRYLFFLFRQPANYRPNLNANNRIAFNIRTFAQQNGLGNAVAAAYMTVKRRPGDP